jgi:hypothetical protein
MNYSTYDALVEINYLLSETLSVGFLRDDEPTLPVSSLTQICS